VNPPAISVEIGIRDVIAFNDTNEAPVGIEGQPQFLVEIDGVCSEGGRMGPTRRSRTIKLAVNVNRLTLQKFCGFSQGCFPWDEEPQIGGVELIACGATCRQYERHP